MSNQYVAIKEAAKMLGVSALTLRNWDKNGRLKALRHPMNNYRVYKIEDLEKIMQGMENKKEPQKREFRKVVFKHLTDEQ